MSILCIIPARGGSRSLPKKNIAMLAGRPLLVYSINQARECLDIDYTIVSTDDDEIAKIARDAGAGVVMRPPEISQDFSPSEDALKHVLENIAYKPEIVVFLQATSPIRKVEHIRRAVAMVEGGVYDSVLSAVRLHQFVWRVSKETGLAWSSNYDPVSGMRPMRQLVDDFVENGSIYCFRTDILELTGKRLGGRIGIVEMPYWSRFEIDSPDDLDLVEWIVAREPLR